MYLPSNSPRADGFYFLKSYFGCARESGEAGFDGGKAGHAFTPNFRLGDVPSRLSALPGLTIESNFLRCLAHIIDDPIHTMFTAQNCKGFKNPEAPMYHNIPSMERSNQIPFIYGRSWPRGSMKISVQRSR
jgi:hypothetical protein